MSLICMYKREMHWQQIQYQNHRRWNVGSFFWWVPIILQICLDQIIRKRCGCKCRNAYFSSKKVINGR